ncbi:IclR family transcriptional regulator [Burkholderia ubonensis]|uniref:IclR family transcriptional regulator n=1 Tax=Burkholderia ubonensis TaxID=101571 RepID=UPI002ABD15B1|nr:helix-turn-helix domain-containing protein [Burkholderia ubonensis]
MHSDRPLSHDAGTRSRNGPHGVDTARLKPPRDKRAEGDATATPLARGLAILCAFGPDRDWLGNREIALETGIPAPTVSRLLQSLVALGYLHHDDSSRKYALAPAALSLGYAAVADTGIQADASDTGVLPGTRGDVDVLAPDSAGAARATRDQRVNARSHASASASPRKPGIAMSPSSPVTLPLDRGLQVLRAFHADRAPLTNGELASRTGLPRSAVSGLTSALVDLGFLRRVAGDTRFELGSNVFGIGQAYLAANPVTPLAQPFLQKLADRLDASSVALAVPDHLDMLYVAHCSGARIAMPRMGVGSLVPMGTTAIGRAWLCGLPDPLRRRQITQLTEAAGPQANAIAAGIEAAYADLRATGVCLSLGENQRDAWSMALPVRVGVSKTLMALSCDAVEPQPDVDAIRRRIVPALKQAAIELATLLRDVRPGP